MTEEETPKRVTNLDLYAVVTGMDTKLDRALSDITDHETRIRVLEKLIWKAMGWAAAIGAGVGLGATILSLLLHG